MIYSFSIFYRNRKCVYHESFLPPLPPGEGQTEQETDSDDRLNLTYGLLVTLKHLSQQLAKSVAGTSPKMQAFNSYTTSQYKLHCLEVPSGYFFICTTPPTSYLDMRDYLRAYYQEFFVPLVLRNPCYGEPAGRGEEGRSNPGGSEELGSGGASGPGSGPGIDRVEVDSVFGRQVRTSIARLNKNAGSASGGTQSSAGGQKS